MKKINSPLFCLFLLFFLLPAFPVSVFSSSVPEQRVFDDASLFSSEEILELEQAIQNFQKETKMDFAIVTADDLGGESTRAYADNFYDEHGFGYEGEYGSGALFLIDMDNREYYISTAGSAIGLYSDDEIDDTLDALYDDMRDGNYGEACRDFVLEARAAVLGVAELKDSYFDREEGRFVTVPEWKKNLSPSHLLAYFATALVISAVVGWIAARKRKTRMTVTGRTYMKDGSLDIRFKNDRYINTTVIRRQIPRNNGGGGRSGGGFSSSHTSSGGHSHGGGGRSF